MSGIFRPRNVLLGLGAGALVVFYRERVLGTKTGNPFETQATRSIGDRWSSGGGSTQHTPGVATARGDASSNATNQENPGGITSAKFREEHLSQREDKKDQSASLGKAWNKAHYGNETGK